MDGILGAAERGDVSLLRISAKPDADDDAWSGFGTIGCDGIC
jgi:hypothetical protein